MKSLKIVLIFKLFVRFPNSNELRPRVYHLISGGNLNRASAGAAGLN